VARCSLEPAGLRSERGFNAMGDAVQAGRVPFVTLGDVSKGLKRGRDTYLDFLSLAGGAQLVRLFLWVLLGYFRMEDGDLEAAEPSEPTDGALCSVNRPHPPQGAFPSCVSDVAIQ